MTAATYGGDTHTVSGITYDANGNIQALSRGPSGAPVDVLSYSYTTGGNKLARVSDTSSDTVGFADGPNTGDDYEYYPDGSLKKDLNRGITLIEYNLLKLPKQLTFSSGKVVFYQYDAGGRKLKMSVTGAGSETRDYVGPFQYLNNALFEIGHEEGRYSPSGGYEYFHKDHLGNVRVVFGSGGITQYTDYDPWGLPLWNGLSGGSSGNRSQFNGKESVAELGAGMYDFGARLQDATIGRWFVVDPLAEKWSWVSPYSHAINNPVNFFDPDGRDVYAIINGKAVLAKRESGEHTFYQDGRKVDALGKDWMAVASSLNQAGRKTLEGLGDSKQAQQLRKEVGIYNAMQTKNSFNELAVDFAGGLELLKGIRLLSERGFTWWAKILGDDVANEVGEITITRSVGAAAKGFAKTINFGKFKVSAELYHRVIKPDILSSAGDFSKLVGKNPDIQVLGDKIRLVGTGPFKGKSLDTGLDALDFFEGL